MRWCWLICFTTSMGLLPLPVLGQERSPRAVSPGAAGEAVRIDTSCPTFSWSGGEHVTGYDLVIYRVLHNGTLEVDLEVGVPGDSRAWTPPLSKCSTPGAQHAWAVRALTDRGPGPWSEPLLFETPGSPSDDEVRRALRTLRRYIATTGEDGTDETGSDRSTATPVAPGTRGRQPGTSPTVIQRDPYRRALTADTVGATRVGAVPPPSFSLSIEDDFDLGGFIFKDGFPLLHTYGGTKFRNTAVGSRALGSVTPSGFTTGAMNTALGYQTLADNDVGRWNTGVGTFTLSNTTGGSSNTGVGYGVMVHNTTGFFNTAIGTQALFYNSVGYYNTAIGNWAGSYLTTGHSNIAIGRGSFGLTGESTTIRIGGFDYQTRTFIEGIRGATGASAFDEAVCTNSEEQLGPCTPSSLRFKKDVAAMGEVAGLSALRPVTFRFRDGEPAGDEPLQYGLIAEEVAEIFPNLVSYDDDGRPSTVRYSLLTPLLLNEVQRQDSELASQRRELQALRSEMVVRDRQLADLRRRLDELAKKKRFR